MPGVSYSYPGRGASTKIPNYSGIRRKRNMRLPKHGNGSGKFDIGAHDMGGWVRVIAGQTASLVEDLRFYLAHRLSAWFREHPHLRLLSVVPINNKDGVTVELHGWYEQHLFPDVSPFAQKPPQK